MKKPYEILFENSRLMVVNKPSGLLSVPDRTQSEPSLKDFLLQQYGQVFTVHRLDKDTSGLIVFAKDEAAHQYLSKAFEARQVEKDYLGLVIGVPAAASGTIDAPMMEHPVQKGTMVVHRKGKAALTDYQVEKAFGKFSLLRFRIHTGRTHQIRVHAKHIGHPIACDPIYGNGQPVLLSALKRHYKLSKAEEAERPILNRLALHAAELRFTGPEGEAFHFSAPLPKDLRALLQQLEKN